MREIEKVQDDGRAAWEFLRSRRDAEYEHVSLQKFDAAYRG